jgi:hypothetical protein
MATNQDFVRGEDQAELLLLAIALEFSEGKLVMGQ